MDNNEYFKNLEQFAEPATVVTKDTHQVVYMNQAARDYYEIESMTSCDMDCHCYDTIRNCDHPCDYCHMCSMELEEAHHWVYPDRERGMMSYCTMMAPSWGEHPAFLEVLRDCRDMTPDEAAYYREHVGEEREDTGSDKEMEGSGSCCS